METTNSKYLRRHEIIWAWRGSRKECYLLYALWLAHGITWHSLFLFFYFFEFWFSSFLCFINGKKQHNGSPKQLCLMIWKRDQSINYLSPGSCIFCFKGTVHPKIKLCYAVYPSTFFSVSCLALEISVVEISLPLSFLQMSFFGALSATSWVPSSSIISKRGQTFLLQLSNSH